MLVLQILLILVGLLLLLRAVSLLLALHWFTAPRRPGTVITVDSAGGVGGGRVYYRLCGEGEPTVVIETGLGASCVEWWAIQDELSKATRVLTYDRAGYGWSAYTSTPRRSGSIALELNALLGALELSGPILLVGHSQGGLYVNHFARLFPDRVAGAVLIDPVSPDVSRFQRELPGPTYWKSGVDESRGWRIASALCRMGLLRFLRPFLNKKAPFRHYMDLPPERRAIVWRHLQLPKMYTTTLSEYALAHRSGQPDLIASAGNFPSVPLRVIYHSGERAVREIVQQGGLKREEAESIEKIGERLAREHLNLSPDSAWIVAEASDRLVHLQSPELVVNTVLGLIREYRGTRHD